MPFERQMSLGRHVHLRQEIDVQLKRASLIVSQICLLLRIDEELLCSGVGATCLGREAAKQQDGH